ncbi:MAG TPA: branched-chain amino acid ABC transporter permease [Anaeromyxobacteraceae bacterium]|nr:branched-chain amino acid ABC transporter permease [Anaeromyxobacteraceae bacterium]
MLLFAQIVVNGLLVGGLYGLMALGMGLVWGVLNIVNLMHGALIMLGGYAVYYLYTSAGLDPFAALPLAMLGLFGLGYALQWFVLGQIARSPLLNTLLVTFGLEVVATYLAQLAFSADLRTINPPYAGQHLALGGLVVPLVPAAAFGAALVLAASLWLALGRTRTGRAIRASAQNLGAARLYGVNPRRIFALTFGTGAALAGAAGGLYGLVAQISPYLGNSLTPKSFVIAILGGLDRPLGVLAGGLALGVAEALTGAYLASTYVDAISFGLLVLLLVARTSRLLRPA